MAGLEIILKEDVQANYLFHWIGSGSWEGPFPHGVRNREAARWTDGNGEVSDTPLGLDPQDLIDQADSHNEDLDVHSFLTHHHWVVYKGHSYKTTCLPLRCFKWGGEP